MAMTHRENAMAILNYQPYEKVPVVSFGFWGQTVDKWAKEGYITQEEADSYKKGGDNSEGDRKIMDKLGFDFNWGSCVGMNVLLDPPFEKEVLEELADGGKIIRDDLGLICMVKPGVVSIPAEIGTSLVDREAWETLYLPKFKMSVVARLKELIKLGGYIPCPDHRIAPDAKFELVQYYCQKMHELD